ncbi:MAG: penicillin-binding protein 1C [Chryseolinea sp.]
MFKDPYSTVLLDSSGQLLSASIAPDGQWRFPTSNVVPEKFKTALIAFEDKNFYSHFGVDVFAMLRATRQNLERRRIVSGGSTISMQAIRLSRKGAPRSLLEKLFEIVLATRLEWSNSKEEIIGLYAAHAPFGGNVVGLEAACWRYFGRDPSQLSWGEASLLAVLPNAPAMIHPGKNRERLRHKRDLLLDKLKSVGMIDEITCSLSKEEVIPEAPQPLPRYARHLLARVIKEGKAGEVVRSTVDHNLQTTVEQLVQDHHQRLRGNQIFNGAAIVLEVSTGNVLAYVGNTDVFGGAHSASVDIITAKRSTGSILKPFLYAASLDEGKILPATLLPDVPTIINGFSPKNFSREYDGAVPANEALVRSLNIPAVNLLRKYRYEKFYELLKRLGMSSLNQPADHYGLSLILGGAEASLWDVAGMYASMGRTLLNFGSHPGSNRYDRKDFHAPVYTNQPSTVSSIQATSWLSAASVFQTFETLTELYRPSEESGWRHFNSSTRIAWKTGTSFGLRDGWAIGITPGYVVGVWIGNADGEGRPGLTGTDAAAPLMFDIFSQLHQGSRWFQRPVSEMQSINVCSVSGQRTGVICPESHSEWVVKAGLESASCAYHKKIHVSMDGKFRVHSGCESVDKIKEQTWFVMSPVEEYYFRNKNISFKALPPFREDCEISSALSPMDLIYPKPNASIFIPRELDGSIGVAVFQLAHHNPSTTVHWHLDGTYVGSTTRKHFLPLNPSTGKHTLVVVDEGGMSLEEHFEVIPRM